ncbi:MAG: hypothetical protein ACO2PO_10780 [Candidatus Calescibacterium sp.]
MRNKLIHEYFGMIIELYGRQ